MNHDQAKIIADETIEAIKNERYKTASGRTLSLDKLIQPAIRGSKLYKPDWIPDFAAKENKSPIISVTHESTLEAAARLSGKNACALNFASAKNPGGGFLRGSIAQEETIARSSALYPTLIAHPEYYEENKRSQKDSIGIYKDYAIYSPNVPVIRNDAGDWLDAPYLISVVTSPAPNRRAILDDFKSEDDELPTQTETVIHLVFVRRMVQVLRIMAENNHRTIILGAWGCGIFGNKPEVVAPMFKAVLEQIPYFDEIVFAIYDKPDSETMKQFKTVFESE